MKPLSEKRALLKLRELKNALRAVLKRNYEHRAKSCETCETKGACCLDAHFVNVHITKLEAVLIKEELGKFSAEKQKEIYARIENAIKTYGLSTKDDTFSKAFACPLFEQNLGCVIHSVKPIPCIQHACYERKQDLPPDELQENAEAKIERLNEQVYQKFPRWMPLPVFLKILNSD